MTEKVLCGDVGGTNDDLAVLEIKDGEYNFLYKEDRSTQRHKNFCQVVNDFLEDVYKEKNIRVDSACFAVAGPVENGRVEMPHAELVVDSEELLQKTELDKVKVINDFDAMGYAINFIREDSCIKIQEGDRKIGKPVTVVGAGTGLGKNFLTYNSNLEAHLPHSSEGGHADLPLVSKKELELAEMIKQNKDIQSEVSYEQVLSGEGLENIYRFYQSEFPDEPKNLSAPEISRTREDNRCSEKTFNKFIEFYARCCRNYVLDTLSEGGLYIAGGIPAKNSEEFDRRFLEEFRNVSKQFSQLLEQIPIFLITDYDISLKGAACAIQIDD